MTQADKPADLPITPERFAELWQLAGELSAASCAHSLWTKIYSERRAMRDKSGSDQGISPKLK